MYQPEKVILYVKPVCGWCRQAEHWLKSQGIKFETVDVMEDPAAFEHMEKISGQTLAPLACACPPRKTRTPAYSDRPRS